MGPEHLQPTLRAVGSSVLRQSASVYGRPPAQVAKCTCPKLQAHQWEPKMLAVSPNKCNNNNNIIIIIIIKEIVLEYNKEIVNMRKKIKDIALVGKL